MHAKHGSTGIFYGSKVMFKIYVSARVTDRQAETKLDTSELKQKNRASQSF